MKEQDKLLLLKDLCARLPYGVKLRYVEDLVVKKESHTITLNNIYLEHIINGDADIKPYLRPMSSMTEEENKQRKELSILLWYNSNGERGFDGFGEISGEDVLKAVDWLNAHHFDYRGLIPKGLALEAPEGMYKL